jgi:hypothetical protein
MNMHAQVVGHSMGKHRSWVSGMDMDTGMTWDNGMHMHKSCVHAMNARTRCTAHDIQVLRSMTNATNAALQRG